MRLIKEYTNNQRQEKDFSKMRVIFRVPSSLKYPIEQCHNFVITTSEQLTHHYLLHLVKTKLADFDVSDVQVGMSADVPCTAGYLISSLRIKIKRINASLVLLTCVIAQSADHQNSTSLFCRRRTQVFLEACLTSFFTTTSTAHKNRLNFTWQ